VHDVGWYLNFTKLCYKNGIKSKINFLDCGVMAEIKDTGKVWFQGAFRPEYALRVENKVFVPGMEESATIDCRVMDNTLIVDLHDQKREKRTLRRFSLDMPAITPASLFNGFEKTQHADVQVVTYKDSGVEEHIVAGDSYRTDSVAGMPFETFYQRFTNFLKKDEAIG
jgi:hypothetical protein